MSLKIFKNNQLAVFAHGCINLNHDYCIFLQIFVRIYCLLYGKSTYTETLVKFHLISIAQKWDQLAFCETVIVQGQLTTELGNESQLGKLVGTELVSELKKLWAIWLLI